MSPSGRPDRLDIGVIHEESGKRPRRECLALEPNQRGDVDVVAECQTRREQSALADIKRSGEERVLRSEVPVDQSVVHARKLGDLPGGDGRRSPVGEELDCGIHQCLADLEAPVCRACRQVRRSGCGSGQPGKAKVAGLRPFAAGAAADGPDYRSLPAPAEQPTMPEAAMAAAGGAGPLDLNVDVAAIAVPEA